MLFTGSGTFDGGWETATFFDPPSDLVMLAVVVRALDASLQSEDAVAEIDEDRPVRMIYDDAAQAAAILSQETGKPVRVQFMRWDEHGWDNYGPAHVGEVQAAVDATGKIVAYEYHGWQHSWCTTETSDQLAFGTAAAERPGVGAQGINPLTLGSMYDVPNLKLVNHKLPGLEYLKGAWLRSPLDLSLTFASEQAIDQLAYLLKIDPLEFRQRNIKDERWLGVLNAAAQAAKWIPRRASHHRSINAASESPTN